MLVFILILSILLPSFAIAEEVPKEIETVVKRGYFGQGGLNLDKQMNRAEFATVSVRLMGLEDEAISYKGKTPFKDVQSFQGGWAVGYTAIAHREGIMEGVNKNYFKPKGTLSYVEMLTVFMRILGYEDGIDFEKYPEDYYKKALEIGLGDLYIDSNQKVSRKTVALTMEKALDLKMKYDDMTLLEKLDKKEGKPKEESKKIKVKDITFNTSIFGTFSGKLEGRDDFRGYKVELLSKNNKVYSSTKVDKDGTFKIWSFDIGVVAKLGGYKYRVYDEKGYMTLEENL